MVAVNVAHGSTQSLLGGSHGREVHSRICPARGRRPVFKRPLVAPHHSQRRTGNPGRSDRPRSLRLPRRSRPHPPRSELSSTRRDPLEGLDWLAQQVAAEAHATAVVYFSGHGWIKTRSSRYFLIPHDVDPLDIPGSAIPADEFINALRQVQAERLLAIIDCCHAEGMATSEGGQAAIKLPPGLTPASPPKAVVDALKQGAGRAVFTSSRGQQLSWVRPDGKMSVYTYHLIEALQGAGNRPGEKAVKLSNLMNYLGKSVPESARDLCSAEQVPFFDTAAEDFAVALLRGGKGLPSGGWPAVEEKAHITIGRIVQAFGEGSVAIGGNVSGSVHLRLPKNSGPSLAAQTWSPVSAIRGPWSS